MSNQAPVPVIRLFQPRDAEEVAALVTAGYGGQWTYQAADLLAEIVSPQAARWVALRGEQVVATLRAAPLAGHPEFVRLGLAGAGEAYSALYLHLLAWLPAGAKIRLVGVVREDYAAQMAFFAHLGFRSAWHSWGAHLDLQAFDAGRFQPLEEKLFLAGYEAQMFDIHAPEADSAADWQALYALQLQGSQDAPRHPITWNPPRSLPELRAALTSGTQVAFVVRFRGQMVASTLLEPDLATSSPTPSSVENDLTVTLPAHRNKGVATMLKAYALAWAKAQGFTRASTGGAVVNLPMLRVNTHLGYQPEAIWITWEKTLQAGADC